MCNNHFGVTTSYAWGYIGIALVIATVIATVIAENNGNPKALWNTFKKILHKSSTIILPDHFSPTDLANTFDIFFSD